MQNTKRRHNRLRLRGAIAILGIAGGVTQATAFTEEQAAQGRDVYASQCATCHGAQLEGKDAPGLSDDTLNNFSTAGGLFDMMSVSMPPQNPGELPDEDYLNTIAYVLSFYGALPDGVPLTANKEELDKIDLLASIKAGKDATGDVVAQTNEAKVVVPQAYTYNVKLPGSDHEPDAPAAPAIPQAYTFGKELPKVE